MNRQMLQAAGLMLLVLMRAGPVRAQRAAPVEPVNITGIEGDLLLSGHYREDHKDRNNGQITDEKDLFLRQEMDLRTSGYFYHPNLVDWNAGLRLGLTQQRIDINDDSFDSDGTITGYNLSGLFLKEKPVSLRTYAYKSEDFIDRSFARQIEMDTRVNGAELMIKGQIPMTLLFEKSYTYEESDIRTDDTHTDLLRFQAIDARNTDLFTELIYEHEDTDKTAVFFADNAPPTVQDLPDRRDDLRINNRWRFRDGSNTHTLYGQTRVLNRRGAFDNDLFSINERLDLQHSDTLSTYYRARVINDETDTQKQDIYGGEVGFIKEYYDSLDIEGRFFGVDATYDSNTEQTLGTFFDIDYRKDTPVGQYTSSLGIGTSMSKQTSDSGLRNVTDEPVILAGITPQRLSEPNIVPGSIVVTDVSNLITYVEGVDYRVQQFGAFTEIARIVTGSIFDGQLVLVDYEALAPENARFRTDRIHWYQRLQLQDTPFALITEYMLRDERLESGEDPGNLDREELIRLGLEYSQDAITIMGEYEQREYRLSPSSKAYSIRGTYDQVLNDTLTTTIGAEYEHLDYTDAEDFNLEPDRDYLDMYRMFGSTTVKLRRDLIARIEASYSDVQGRDNDRLARVGGSLDYRRGNLFFTISAFHEEYKQEEDTGDSDVVRFTLRRSF